MRIHLSIFLFLFSIAVSAQSIELANSYFTKGEYEKAILLYKPLFESNPIRQDYFKTLLTCYQQIEKYSEAQILLEEQLSRFPNQIYLNVEIGYNYQLQGMNEIAEQYYKKSIQFIYKNPSYCFLIGRTFRQNHLLDYALQSYLLGKELNPKLNTEINEAQIHGEKGDLEKMFSLYLDLLDKNENYYTTVQRYVSYFVTEDKNDPTNLLFKKLLLKRAQNNPKDSWNILLSWLFMQQQDYIKALIQEKSLYNRKPGSLQRVQEIGTISYVNKDFETANKAFQFIADKSDESFIDFQSKLQADIYLLKIENKMHASVSGRKLIYQKYQQLLQQYGLSNKTIELQLAYTDFLTYAFDQPEIAIEHLKKTIPMANSAMEKGMIQMKIADILVFTDQFNQALLLYSQIQYDLKNSILAQEARFKVARTSYFKGDFKWAQNQLKILKSSTSQLIANDALDLSLKISNNLENDSLNEGLRHFARAELLRFQHKNKEAIDTLSYVLLKFKGRNIEDDALYTQAELYIEQGDYMAAENNLLNLLDHHPESVLTDDTIFKLGKLYLGPLNDPLKAKDMFERIIFEFPSSIYLVDSRKAFRKLRGDEL